jgi:hypothetical protein
VQSALPWHPACRAEGGGLGRDPRRESERHTLGWPDRATGLARFPTIRRCLVVTRIDRLARSLRDLQNIVHELKERRVTLRATEQPRAPRDRRYEWAYLFGAICPERGTGAAIVMPEVNVAAMNEHLAEISRSVSVGATALLVLDGAGWHNSPRLELPDNIVLLPLPPYAPELNPMEMFGSSCAATF